MQAAAGEVVPGPWHDARKVVWCKDGGKVCRQRSGGMMMGRAEPV